MQQIQNKEIITINIYSGAPNENIVQTKRL